MRNSNDKHTLIEGSQEAHGGRNKVVDLRLRDWFIRAVSLWTYTMSNDRVRVRVCSYSPTSHCISQRLIGPEYISPNNLWEHCYRFDRKRAPGLPFRSYAQMDCSRPLCRLCPQFWHGRRCRRYLSLYQARYLQVTRYICQPFAESAFTSPMSFDADILQMWISRLSRSPRPGTRGHSFKQANWPFHSADGESLKSRYA